MKTLHKKLHAAGRAVAGALLLSATPAAAQDDVMMQAFYWEVPVDASAKNGTWWDNLHAKSDTLKTAGFKALWVPSPAKGNFGIYDMGYGIFDHYNLDGQEGLFVPGLLRQQAGAQGADRLVSQQAGPSLAPTFGAQAVAAGVETAKRLLSGKIRRLHVTLPAGHRLLLLDRHLTR